MSKLKLTVQEAVEELLMSQSTIYSWIDKGFLKIEDTPAGRVIIISEEELQQIRERNLKSKRNKVSKQITSQNTQETTQNVVDAEIVNHHNSEDILNNLPVGNNLEVIKIISDLATKAGKFELLEDIQKQKQEDVEYWRGEYFKINTQMAQLQQENAILIKEKANFEKQISELNETIKKLKRPFGRFFN